MWSTRCRGCNSVHHRRARCLRTTSVVSRAATATDGPSTSAPAAPAAASSAPQNVVAVLRARGLLQEVTSDELEQSSTQAMLKVYCGFDPTANSLHLGNLLGIVVLSWFQRWGCDRLAVAHIHPCHEQGRGRHAHAACARVRASTPAAAARAHARAACGVGKMLASCLPACMCKLPACRRAGVGTSQWRCWAVPLGVWATPRVALRSGQCCQRRRSRATCQVRASTHACTRVSGGSVRPCSQSSPDTSQDRPRACRRLHALCVHTPDVCRPRIMPPPATHVAACLSACMADWLAGWLAD